MFATSCKKLQTLYFHGCNATMAIEFLLQSKHIVFVIYSQIIPKLNVHSTTHIQLSCQESGSSGQLFHSCKSSSALHSQAPNKTQGLSSSALYFQGRSTTVGLFKPQSPNYKCGTFADLAVA